MGWREKQKEYNAKGYKYLGLSAHGMDMFSEWLTPNGVIVRLYYDDSVRNVKEILEEVNNGKTSISK